MACETPRVLPDQPSEEATGPDELGTAPDEAIASARVRAPTRGNRRLDALLEAAGRDPELRGWWHMAQVTSERLGMSDHSWVHVQIVLNVALRLLRLLVKGGIEPAMVADHGMGRRDAEVVVAAGALLHDVGMSIHRTDHEAYSLFLAERKLRELLDGVYEEPERTVVASEALHAIIGHRRAGHPYTVEAGVVRVADALDMAQGRTRLPVESGQMGIHALSAAAIDSVSIEAGEERPVRVEITMNNSAGIFQVDDLLATKLRGTPLEGQVEVVASVQGETEKRLLGEFRLPD
jgi:metal-dependent HD superfamily phosphatase/phosphodiesterase